MVQMATAVVQQRKSILTIPSGRLISIAIFLFVLSLYKFVRRDPLGTNLGLQGPLELMLVASGLVLSLFALLVQHRNFRLPSSIIYVYIFSIFTSISSINSFWPTLSFVKAIMFVTIVTTAVMACNATSPRRVLTWLYWAIVWITLLGVFVSIVAPEHYPLFRSSSEGGPLWRAWRLWIFETHAGVVADYVALAFLLGYIVKPTKSWASQVFLLVANVTCAGRTSSALLLLGIGVMFLSRLPRKVYLGLVLASVPILCIGLLAVVALEPSDAGAQGTQAFIEKARLEWGSFNGRTPIWKYGLELLETSWMLGYGFEGTRVLFLERVSWSTSSHSGYLDLLLTAGILGGVFLFLGWFRVLRQTRALESRRDRIGVYLIHLYLGLTAIIGGQMPVVPGLGIFLLVVTGMLTQERVTYRRRQLVRHSPQLQA